MLGLATGTSGTWAADPHTQMLHVLQPGVRGPQEVYVPLQTELVSIEGQSNVTLVVLLSWISITVHCKRCPDGFRPDRLVRRLPPRRRRAHLTLLDCDGLQLFVHCPRRRRCARR
jgi:hypothetical protein